MAAEFLSCQCELAAQGVCDKSSTLRVKQSSFDWPTPPATSQCLPCDTDDLKDLVTKVSKRSRELRFIQRYGFSHFLSEHT